MSITQKLEQMGLELPPVPSPVGAYVPAIRSGHLIFTAGQLPMREGKLIAEGKVPGQVGLAQAKEAAKQAALNALAAASQVAGDIDNVHRMVRVTVYVASQEGFHDQAEVANGASELLGRLFGDQGVHARCAVGVASLPKNSPVEIDLICETR
jgi:enamine deaminase RidA (YjgF/YER057c/UK114 family)